jgi:hypothetical protein
VLTLVILSACRQGIGDRCQLDTDCADGLVCALIHQDDRITGGTCAGTGGPDAAAGLDFSPPLDLSLRD